MIWIQRATAGARGAVVGLLAVLTVGGSAPAWAVSASTPDRGLVQGTLNATAATSSSNVWAVGTTNSLEPLIIHWNGIGWMNSPSPTPPGGILNAVTARSADTTWAVGTQDSGALILKWNGASWTQVASPSGGHSPELTGVAAASASNAWAVGYHSTKSLGQQHLTILRWNGVSWKLASAPRLSNGQLNAVAAPSTKNAWAVGTADGRALILRWNGATWTRATTPAVTGTLYGVTATSGRNAWAVGVRFARGRGSCTGGSGCPLVLHWNGSTWRQQAVPNPPSDPRGNWLFAVTASSARSAWAVGGTSITDSDSHTLIFHWNGTTWRRVHSPSPSGAPNLLGAAATSARNAWAVGTFTDVPGTFVVLRWNGSAWTRVL